MADIHMPCGCFAQLESSDFWNEDTEKFEQRYPNGEISYCQEHSIDTKEKLRILVDLANQKEDTSIAGVSVHETVEALEEAGWERGEFESNGWQWDYWIDMTKGETTLCLSGSGYYGKCINLSYKEEEEEQ